MEEYYDKLEEMFLALEEMFEDAEVPEYIDNTMAILKDLQYTDTSLSDVYSTLVTTLLSQLSLVKNKAIDNPDLSGRIKVIVEDIDQTINKSLSNLLVRSPISDDDKEALLTTLPPELLENPVVSDYSNLNMFDNEINVVYEHNTILKNMILDAVTQIVDYDTEDWSKMLSSFDVTPSQTLADVTDNVTNSLLEDTTASIETLSVNTPVVKCISSVNDDLKVSVYDPTLSGLPSDWVSLSQDDQYRFLMSSVTVKDIDTTSAEWKQLTYLEQIRVLYNAFMTQWKLSHDIKRLMDDTKINGNKSYITYSPDYTIEQYIPYVSNLPDGWISEYSIDDKIAFLESQPISTADLISNWKSLPKINRLAELKKAYDINLAKTNKIRKALNSIKPTVDRSIVSGDVSMYMDLVDNLKVSTPDLKTWTEASEAKRLAYINEQISANVINKSYTEKALGIDITPVDSDNTATIEMNTVKDSAFSNDLLQASSDASKQLLSGRDIYEKRRALLYNRLVSMGLGAINYDGNITVMEPLRPEEVEREYNKLFNGFIDPYIAELLLQKGIEAALNIVNKVKPTVIDKSLTFKELAKNFSNISKDENEIHDSITYASEMYSEYLNAIQIYTSAVIVHEEDEEPYLEGADFDAEKRITVHEEYADFVSKSWDVNNLDKTIMSSETQGDFKKRTLTPSDAEDVYVKFINALGEHTAIELDVDINTEDSTISVSIKPGTEVSTDTTISERYAAVEKNIKSISDKDDVSRTNTKGLSMKEIADNINETGFLNFNLSTDIDNLRNKFSRFTTLGTSSIQTHGRAYAFFTRPSLNLAKENLVKTRSIPQILEDNEWIRNYLNDDADNNANPFMPLFGNAITDSDMPDISLELFEAFKDRKGITQKFGGVIESAIKDVPLSMTFQDNRYNDVLNLIRVWTYYISELRGGRAAPLEKYSIQKKVDYMSSTYIIDVGEDGETIIGISKWLGIYPTSVPMSKFNFKRMKSFDDLNPPMAVSFNNVMLVPLDLILIPEFNRLVLDKAIDTLKKVGLNVDTNSTSKDILDVSLKAYNSLVIAKNKGNDIFGPLNTNYGSIPFIVPIVYDNGEVSYKLKFI